LGVAAVSGAGGDAPYGYAAGRRGRQMDYEAAQEAAQSGDWLTAIELYERALTEEPEPGARKRTYGMHFIVYYPYLELGKAYLEIGDRSQAKKYCDLAQKKSVAEAEEVQKCLDLAGEVAAVPTPTPMPTLTPTAATPTPTVTPATPQKTSDTWQKKTETLRALNKTEKIDSKLYDCALNMLVNKKSNKELDLFLSGDITAEAFNQLFQCDSQ